MEKLFATTDLDGKTYNVEYYDSDRLDDYDHQRISKPKGNVTTYVLTDEECKEAISKMKFTSDSELFERLLEGLNLLKHEWSN